MMPGTLTVLTSNESCRWREIVQSIPHHQITHYPQHAKVYEDYGDGSAECVYYEKDGYQLAYPFIRRPLSRLPFPAEELSDHFDIVTPYCYGGYIHDAPENESEGLIHSFRRVFDEYCFDTKILTEFVRFHPLLQNQRHGEKCFDGFRFHQPNVVVDLRLSEAQLLANCRQSYQPLIRQSIRNGLELTLGNNQEGIGAFSRLYNTTMQHHHQIGYLNFPESYFLDLVNNMNDNLRLYNVVYQGRIIASSLFLCYKDTLDYFLSASNRDYLHLHPNHFMLYSVACMAKNLGFKLMHLGGGRNSLVFFKSGFSKETVPFYFAQRLHNPPLTELLRQKRALAPPALPDGPAQFFPPYRQGFE